MNCLDKYADNRDHSAGQLAVGDEDKFSFSDLKKLNCLYVLVIVNCLLTYICVFPFLGVATTYFEVRFGLSEKHAGTVVVIFLFTLSQPPISSQGSSLLF